MHLTEGEPGCFSGIGIVVRPGLTNAQLARVMRVVNAFPRAVEQVVGGPIHVRVGKLARA